MIDDQERAPVGVTIAGVILGLMAVVGLLITAGLAVAMFVIKSPLIPRIPSVRIAVGGLGALILALVILAACTIVGLFRLKIWARYSMILLGLLDLLVFGLITAGVLIGRVKSGMAALPIPNHPSLTLGDIMLGLASFYAVLALIGVWWMIYFNLDGVRLAFVDAEARLRAERSGGRSFLGLH
ncbi:MAG: hypothetical protein WA634_07040 [Silvibacterium sp.]